MIFGRWGFIIPVMPEQFIDGASRNNREVRDLYVGGSVYIIDKRVLAKCQLNVGTGNVGSRLRLQLFAPEDLMMCLERELAEYTHNNSGDADRISFKTFRLAVSTPQRTGMDRIYIGSEQYTVTLIERLERGLKLEFASPVDMEIKEYRNVQMPRSLLASIRQREMGRS